MIQNALGTFTIPFSFLLIGFLAYGSQTLFHYIQPGPLSFNEALVFNVLVACTYIGYVRSCFTDPGWVPKNWAGADDKSNGIADVRSRWCKKCEAPKPPRSHHCKTCGKCIPKMDHHCPWTTSCISYRTIPHFCRFLFYGVVAMTYLSRLLYTRILVIWEARNLPSYLGPSVTSMIFLFMICVTNFATIFGVGLLLFRNLWCLGSNTTTIEGWEIERHETLVRKARRSGGYLDGPGGVRVKITKQEFPYDVGIWQNINQGMGTSFLFWLWPFAATPRNDNGLRFDTNGFEDPSTLWPPPDPDRMSRPWTEDFDATREKIFSSEDYIKAFQQRQRDDLRRRAREDGHQADEGNVEPRMTSAPGHINDPSAAAWKDSDGDRLEDFGVDEEFEFFDEDELPLAELIRRKRRASARWQRST